MYRSMVLLMVGGANNCALITITMVGLVLHVAVTLMCNFCGVFSPQSKTIQSLSGCDWFLVTFVSLYYDKF